MQNRNLPGHSRTRLHAIDARAPNRAQLVYLGDEAPRSMKIHWCIVLCDQIAHWKTYSWMEAHRSATSLQPDTLDSSDCTLLVCVRSCPVGWDFSDLSFFRELFSLSCSVVSHSSCHVIPDVAGARSDAHRLHSRSNSSL
jgi:hypothetical protein